MFDLQLLFDDRTVSGNAWLHILGLSSPLGIVTRWYVQKYHSRSGITAWIEHVSILNDSWPSTDDFLWEINNTRMYRYVDLLHYNQHIHLHVLTTICRHPQRGVLWRNMPLHASRHYNSNPRWMVLRYTAYEQAIQHKLFNPYFIF